MFWHALVRDVAYAQIPRWAGPAATRRSPSGSRRWPGSGSATWPRSSPTTTARRWPYARAAREPQAQIDKLVEPTRRFLVLAGDRTINLDLDRARAYYRQAVELGQPRTPSAPPAGQDRAGGVPVRRLPGGGGRLRGGDRRPAPSRRPPVLGATLGRLATVFWNQGDTRRANAVLTEAIELLEREPPGPSWSRPTSGWPATGSSPATPPRPSTGPTRPWPWPTSWAGCPGSGPRLDARGMARCDLGDFGGMDDLRSGLALGLELGSGYDTAVLYNNLAEPVWLVEGPDAAWRSARTGSTSPSGAASARPPCGCAPRPSGRCSTWAAGRRR